MKDLSELQSQIESLKAQIREFAEKQSSSKDLYELKKSFLDSKQGKLSALMKEMAQVPAEQKANFGKSVNEAKQWALGFFDDIDKKLKEKELKLRYESEKIDISMPSVKQKSGNLHPITTVRNQLIDIFAGMGFSVYEGTEIEKDFYNFTALNTPADHPARDMQDT
ncbi:MAG: phenylalanine--tRNA ligase subunit alpha, partial [Lachnospiraceae bacterium]|nr:phenylalanine--tRNA ligase subunit alpha [Lachnospiraceae bacterium]